MRTSPSTAPRPPTSRSAGTPVMIGVFPLGVPALFALLLWRSAADCQTRDGRQAPARSGARGKSGGGFRGGAGRRRRAGGTAAGVAAVGRAVATRRRVASRGTRALRRTPPEFMRGGRRESAMAVAAAAVTGRSSSRRGSRGARATAAAITTAAAAAAAASGAGGNGARVAPRPPDSDSRRVRDDVTPHPVEAARQRDVPVARRSSTVTDRSGTGTSSSNARGSSRSSASHPLHHPGQRRLERGGFDANGLAQLLTGSLIAASLLCTLCAARPYLLRSDNVLGDMPGGGLRHAATRDVSPPRPARDAPKGRGAAARRGRPRGGASTSSGRRSTSASRSSRRHLSIGLGVLRRLRDAARMAPAREHTPQPLSGGSPRSAARPTAARRDG